MRVINVLLVLGLLSMISCSKERNENFEYLIFGHFYGECIGDNCVANFKIEDQKIYEDANDSYNGSQGFDFVKLNDSMYELVIKIADDIPNELLSEENQTFGCPDCADQGGLYIEYGTSEKIGKWSIDQNKSSVPEYLHSYMDLINEKIDLLLE